MIPKAELHVHLEGTAPPSLVRRLAERNGHPAPRGRLQERGRRSTGRTSCTSSPPTTWRRASSARRRTTATSPTSTSPAAPREGAVYVELIASPDHAAAGRPVRRRPLRRHRRRGSTTPAPTTGSRPGSSIAAIRNLGVEAAEAIARRLAEDRHPYVVGFNLAGDEAAWPPAPFARAYEIAADSGLGCTVHAGEHAGAESVRGALELPVTRISHGVRAIEDPALVAELAERGIDPGGLPDLATWRSGVFPSYEDHPLGALRDAGVRVTLGSDDPPYFGCSIGSEYAVARERFGLDEGAADGDDADSPWRARSRTMRLKEALLARLDLPEFRDSH